MGSTRPLTTPSAVKGKSDQWLIRKSKTAYHKQLPADNMLGRTGQADITPGGGLEAILDTRQGNLVRVEGTETATVMLKEKMVGRAESTVKFVLLRSEMVPEDEQTALDRQRRQRERMARAVSLYVIPNPEGGEQGMMRNELGEATVESLLVELAQLEKSAPDVKATQALYLKFKALAYLYPEKSDLLGQHCSAPGRTARPCKC